MCSELCFLHILKTSDHWLTFGPLAYLLLYYKKERKGNIFLYTIDKIFYCLIIRVDLVDWYSFNPVNLSTVQINVSYLGKIIQAIILENHSQILVKKKKKPYFRYIIQYFKGLTKIIFLKYFF